MEMMTLLIVVAAIIGAVWYGLFNMVGVASEMGTRELNDLARTQKLRILTKHASANDIKDADIDKSAKRISKLDALEI